MIVVEIVLAFLILPFVVGYALGHGVYAAAVFAALAATVVFLSLTGGGEPDVMAGFAGGLLLSALPAYLGGFVRERRRDRRERRLS